MNRFPGTYCTASLLPLLLVSAFCVLAVTPRHCRASDDEVIPGAPHLLPEKTFAYARLDSADDLREGMADSPLGRMLSDENLKPFADDLYATLTDLFSMISSQVGVTLDELLSIPSGQVAIALLPRMVDEERDIAEPEPIDESDDAIRRRIAQKRRQEYGFAIVAMIDAGENVDKLQAIIDRLEQRMLSGAYVRRNTNVGSTEIVRLLPQRLGRIEVEYFQRDGTIVFGFGHRTAQDVLDRWLDKSEEPTLADNADFASVMSRCVGAEATRPQLTFFADPYAIAERVVKLSGSLTAGMMWPVAENLGLARIRGIGGSTFRGGEVFEDISHLHLLIDPPRDGLLGVLRPETGESRPPNWVPSDTTNYTSLQWDIENTYRNVGKILEKFQGPGALDRFVEAPMQKRNGISVQDDLIANLTGRYVRAIWIQPPMKLNSQVQANALELSDPIAAKSVIAKYRDRRPNEVTVETIGSNIVYFAKSNSKRIPESFRRPEPCFTIVGNWFIQTDSRQFVERLLRAHSGAIGRLAELPEYDLIASELGGKLDGEDPFWVSFMRGSDFIRQFYEMAKSDENRKVVRKIGEKNVLARKMSELLQRNELPPYEQFEKYFAPSGVYAYDEPTGIHLGSFTLRPDE